MKKVWKYELTPTHQTFEMPTGAKIVSVILQRGGPVMYAEVDPTAPLVKRNFIVVATGDSVYYEDAEFIATIGLADGALVFHVFEV
jgi:hypothetical protein